MPFSQILNNGEKNYLSQGFRVGKESIPITHLHYADDTLLFLDEGKNHLINLISLIHCFELVSGMEINWKKSCLVGLHSNMEEYKEIFNILDCQIRSLPIDYLGVPLGGNARSREV